jgi:ABC-type multidrug transport system fused ATPase/permease subunit
MIYQDSSKKNFGYRWLKYAQEYGLTVRTLLILFVLSLTATLTEIFGVGLFLPIFQFIRMQGDIQSLVSESPVWEYIVDWFRFVGFDVSLVVLLSISFSLFLGRQLFAYIRMVYQAAVTQQLVQTIRMRIFRRYLDADTAFHDQMPVGNLVNAMTVEVTQAVIGIMAPLNLFIYLIMIVGYVVILSILSWEMTLASVVVLFGASQVPKIWIRMSANVSRKLANANTEMSSFLVGRLKSPRLVRLAGTYDAEVDELRGLTQLQRKHSVFGSVLRARTEVVMEPVVIGLSLIFLYLAYTVLNMQIEIIGLYLIVALRLMPIVKGVITQLQTVQRFIGSIEVVDHRLSEMEVAKEKDTGILLINEFNKLAFNEITFTYSGASIKALDRVTFEIKSGTMVAIVGPSGSGKSTMIDLIPRLRPLDSGTIRIGNVSVEEYQLLSLRKSIAFVPQSPQIFDGTVSNHIRYGKPNATDQEVMEAAHLAAADQFIEKLPDKYGSLLGEDAVKLSGGQRQRLDLARALVRKAPLLILDEPTSNLDAESEDAFHQALSRILKETNTTIIIVAHRLASIFDADQIVVLNRGKVEEIGKHHDLMQQNGWYRKAWEIQEGKIKA